MDEQQNIIIYRTADGRASVALYAKDGKIWLNQHYFDELLLRIRGIFVPAKQLTDYSQMAYPFYY